MTYSRYIQGSSGLVILCVSSLLLLLFCQTLLSASAAEVEVCETQEGGKCLNTASDTCDGALVAGLCSGSSAIKCCIPTPTFQSTQCLRQLDECWLTSRASSCQGSIVRGKCPGSSRIACCEKPNGAIVPQPTSAELAKSKRVVIIGASVMQSIHVGKRLETWFRDTVGAAVIRLHFSGKGITQLRKRPEFEAALRAWKPNILYVAAGTNRDWSGKPEDVTKTFIDFATRILNEVSVPSYRLIWLGAFPECRANSGYKGATKNSQYSNTGIEPAVAAAGGLWFNPFDANVYGTMPAISCADGIHPSSADGQRLVDNMKTPILNFINGVNGGGGSPPPPPPTPTTPPAAVTCSANGVSGVCKDVSLCATPTNVPVPGFCPGAAGVQCCIPNPEPPTTDPVDPNVGKDCYVGSVKGVCQETNKCTGESVSNKCPGPAEIKCCIPPRPPPTTTPPVPAPTTCSPSSGVSGTCIHIDDCDGVGDVHRGFCSGPAYRICCVPRAVTAPPPAQQCFADGITGSCVDTSAGNSVACQSGTLHTWKCTCPSNIRCCTPPPSSPPPPPTPDAADSTQCKATYGDAAECILSCTDGEGFGGKCGDQGHTCCAHFDMAATVMNEYDPINAPWQRRALDELHSELALFSQMRTFSCMHRGQTPDGTFCGGESGADSITLHNAAFFTEPSSGDATKRTQQTNAWKWMQQQLTTVEALKGAYSDFVRTWRTGSNAFLPDRPDYTGSRGNCQTPYHGYVGKCISTSKCTGATFNGLCPGSWSIKCCVEEKTYARPTAQHLTLAQFKAAFDKLSDVRAAALWPYFNEAMDKIMTDHPDPARKCYRIAAFVGQISHESNGMQYFEEEASGAAYNGRCGPGSLGNCQPGDGPRFKGRGPIQLTGRSNYRNAGRDLNMDFEANPEQLCFPSRGFAGTVWYWNKHSLNNFATDSYADFTALTKLINGGTNGITDRRRRWAAAKASLGCDSIPKTSASASFVMALAGVEGEGADGATVAAVQNSICPGGASGSKDDGMSGTTAGAIGGGIGLVVGIIAGGALAALILSRKHAGANKDLRGIALGQV